MALSENEQKLANNLIGKIVYNKPYNLIDTDAKLVFTINDKGMILSSDYLNHINVISRNDFFYSRYYEKEVLEDNLNEFKPSFKFKTYAYYNAPFIELYQNDNTSLIYEIESNKIKLSKNDNFKELYDDEIKDINLSTEAMDKIEKYQESINAVVEDLHNQISNKQNLLENIRNQYAYDMVKYETSESDYQSREASEELSIIKEFYDELKSGLSTEEIEEENRLFNEAFNEKTKKRQIEINESKQLQLKNLEIEKNEVKEKLKYLDKIKKFENKIYINNLKEVSKLLYADENGIVKSTDNSIRFLNFSHSFVEPASFELLTEAFSQKNYVGEILKPNSGYEFGTDFVLFKNDKNALVLSINSGDYYLHLLKNDDYYKNNYKEYPIDETTAQGHIDILNQFSDIHNVEAYFNDRFSKQTTKDKIESSLITNLAIEICEKQGKKDDIGFNSSYCKELDSKLIQSFTENWIKKNNMSNEDIDNFYKNVEADAKYRMYSYDERQKNNEQQRKNKKIKDEQEIAKVVAKKLGLTPTKEFDIFKFPDVLNFNDNTKPETQKIISHRRGLEITDTPIIISTKLSEGNMGALNVIMKILNMNMEKNMTPKQQQDIISQNIIKLLTLDDMNIRGSQIWILYKHIYNIDCDRFNEEDKANFATLTEKILNRDKEVVEKLNDYSKKHHLKDKAVISGASFIIADRKDASSLYFDESEFEPIVKSKQENIKMAKPKLSLIEKLNKLFRKNKINKDKENDNSFEDDNERC